MGTTPRGAGSVVTLVDRNRRNRPTRGSISEPRCKAATTSGCTQFHLVIFEGLPAYSRDRTSGVDHDQVGFGADGVHQRRDSCHLLEPEPVRGDRAHEAEVVSDGEVSEVIAGANLFQAHTGGGSHAGYGQVAVDIGDCPAELDGRAGQHAGEGGFPGVGSADHHHHAVAVG